MEFKLVVLCALLSAANAGLHPVGYSAPEAHYTVANPSQDAFGSTQHKVGRSYEGTVSQYSKTLAYTAPQAVYSHAVPATVYSQQVAPASVYSHHAAPTVYSNAAPAAVYAQPAAHAITYSPAATVAHVTFDGFGAHYGY